LEPTGALLGGAPVCRARACRLLDRLPAHAPGRGRRVSL